METITQARPSLTNNDAAVLQALFDAESSPSSGVKVDPTLPSWPAAVNISQTDLTTLKTRETQIILNLQATSTPTEETVQTALKELNTLLEEYPTYPPAYTNRAQTLRLLADLEYNNHTTHSAKTESEPESITDESLFTPEASDLSSKIFADLGKAITLATPVSPADPISSVQARLLADAHTHRGYLLLKAARVKKTRPGVEVDSVGPERLRGHSADQLEEMASRDFFLGGRYGNKVAQQMAVQTNPYAKMCGAIVKEAMRKEMEG
ncbi:uncharacterized protein N7473_002962 [Penicillium subrubescens]|jgi:hypothetical protein|uniref:Tetratricopeptide repeat protein 36-like protein n=1 Tax=Penicillium subrubescens TaxID=1316194 RepID=A0A1Q5TDK3_9EURO|nr:uncharacterized protein N7473_002962 [Penicillium subrubescens]KAJ5906046.1 hypothetical protein N7473_002962 [Penicillium subrubescens]OKO98306.1 hypothetical protein PENSUB_9404 [Penicillium subrubescens]